MQWLSVPDGSRQVVPASERILSKVDVIGFQTSDDGRVLAVAANEQFTLERLPPGARYCVWSVRVPKEPSETRLRKEAILANIGALGLGILDVAVEAAFDALLNGDHDDHHHHHRHSHHHDDDKPSKPGGNAGKSDSD